MKSYYLTQDSGMGFPGLYETIDDPLVRHINVNKLLSLNPTGIKTAKPFAQWKGFASEKQYLKVFSYPFFISA